MKDDQLHYHLLSSFRILCVYLCSSVVAVSAIGCGSPNKANIELRKQNQAFREEIESLKRQKIADAATIAALESPGNTVEQLSKQRLDELYTASGLSFGRLTGPYDSDPSTPGIESIRVQVTPTDAEGDQLKAAGTFHIEAFDGPPESPRKFAEWHFDQDQSRAAWLGRAMQYGYLFNCPLPDRPSGPRMTVRASFTDTLSRRQLVAEQDFPIGP